jgi:hypothetical protein
MEKLLGVRYWRELTDLDGKQTCRENVADPSEKLTPKGNECISPYLALPFLARSEDNGGVGLDNGVGMAQSRRRRTGGGVSTPEPYAHLTKQMLCFWIAISSEFSLHLLIAFRHLQPDHSIPLLPPSSRAECVSFLA